jgi:hypothetical protein
MLAGQIFWHDMRRRVFRWKFRQNYPTIRAAGKRLLLLVILIIAKATSSNSPFRGSQLSRSNKPREVRPLLDASTLGMSVSLHQ